VIGRNLLNSTRKTTILLLTSTTDADAYVAWLARKTSQPYRLPTEAEWICRQGQPTRYYWGNDIEAICQFANIRDQTAKKRRMDERLERGELRRWFRVHRTRCSFKPNAFGLYDMLGNAAEAVAIARLKRL